MYHIIFNPKSKGSQSRDVCRMVLAQLKVRDIDYTLYKTDHARHAEEIAHMLTRGHVPCTILVIGGDGTMNEVLNGICYPDCVTLGLIPSGSGNDFAKAAGIPKDPQKALDLILSGKTANIHYGIMRAGRKKRRFLISCGAGFDSEICREVHHSRLKKFLSLFSLGNLVYTVIAVKRMILRTVFSADLLPDTRDAQHFDNITFVTAFNSSYEGGGFRFCPPADPRQGKLHVLCAHDIPLYALPPLFPLARIGKHLRFTSKIALQDTYHATLSFSQPVCIHTDGEVLGYSRHLDISASRASFNMYWPQ